MKITLPEITPGEWDIMEAKTLLHVESTNNGDGSICGLPVCSIPKKRIKDARAIAAAAPAMLKALAKSLEFLDAILSCPPDEIQDVIMSLGESLESDLSDSLTLAGATVEP